MELKNQSFSKVRDILNKAIIFRAKRYCHGNFTGAFP